MRFLTEKEARTWCAELGIGITQDRFVRFPGGGSKELEIELKGPAYSVIALSNYLVPSWEPESFRGAVLWIRSWGIGNDDSERTGMRIIEQMRLASGESRPLSDTPAILFEQHEMPEMYSYFVLPLLFGWDAFLIPVAQDYMVYVSHDEIAFIISKTQDAHDSARRRLKDWEPMDSSWYLKHANAV